MPAARAPDPATPLWRAAQVFRLLSCIYALGFQIAVNAELDRPAVAWALFGVLIGWSAACAAAYLQGYGRRPAWVLVEVVVVAVLMSSTGYVASDQWAADNQSWPTTLWATNAVISAAILVGPIAGMATALVVVGASAALKGYVSVDVGRNATVVIELAVGLAIGMAAQTARRAHAELQRAARLAASLEERDRLSREVHDGAIQVLALVARRGREIGGATDELVYAITMFAVTAGVLVGGDVYGFFVGHMVATICWIALAAGVLRYAAKLPRAQRSLPIGGGMALVAAAMAKLFLFDLGTLDGIFRVIVFIVVGLVLLGMGASYARLLAQQ
jgi:Predicted membrane protein (DUF2339)/Family of unknown function (DUF5931)